MVSTVVVLGFLHVVTCKSSKPHGSQLLERNPVSIA